MVVKFFANKKGGSSKAIDYLLNERREQGTARLLKGDEQLTRDIIKDINYKQKTTVGCLSFEEQDISEELKQKLMEDFEKMLLSTNLVKAQDLQDLAIKERELTSKRIFQLKITPIKGNFDYQHLKDIHNYIFII